MHRARNVHHIKRQGLIPDILSGVVGNELPTISVPLGEITKALPTIIGPFSSLDPSSITSKITDSPTSTSSTSPPLSSSSITSTTSSQEPAPSIPPHTVTTLLGVTPSPTQSIVPPPPKSFLHNKVLSGVVFALIGLVGLAVIIGLITFTLRKKRKNRLLREAISFDPSSTISSDHHYGAERGKGSTEKDSISARGSDEQEGSKFELHRQAYPPGLAHNTHFRQPLAHVAGPYQGGVSLMPQPETINWGPSLTPFTAPLPDMSGETRVHKRNST